MADQNKIKEVLKRIKEMFENGKIGRNLPSSYAREVLEKIGKEMNLTEEEVVKVQKELEKEGYFSTRENDNPANNFLP